MIQYYGRKKILIFASSLGYFFKYRGGFVVLCGFTYNIYTLILTIFFSGWSLTGLEITTLVYVSEIGGDRFRKFSLSILMIGWAFAQIIFPSVIYFVNNWRITFIFVIGVPLIILSIIGNFILDETPRYLVSIKRYE